MPTLAERVDAAIARSGKSVREIARAIGVHEETIRRICRGEEDNSGLQTFVGIARETGTTVGAFLGDSFDISEEDEETLLRFRGWIDAKLQTIDALHEPNAVIVREMAPALPKESRIADRPRPASDKRSGAAVDPPVDANVQLVLRALGESMIEEGILPDDDLHATPLRDGESPIGNIVACRIGENVFVKRLVSEHDRRYLVSGHPRYRPIAVEPHRKTFHILGIVVGRIGRVRAARDSRK